MLYILSGIHNPNKLLLCKLHHKSIQLSYNNSTAATYTVLLDIHGNSIFGSTTVVNSNLHRVIRKLPDCNSIIQFKHQHPEYFI